MDENTSTPGTRLFALILSSGLSLTFHETLRLLTSPAPLEWEAVHRQLLEYMENKPQQVVIPQQPERGNGTDIFA